MKILFILIVVLMIVNAIFTSVNYCWDLFRFISFLLATFLIHIPNVLFFLLIGYLFKNIYLFLMISLTLCLIYEIVHLLMIIYDSFECANPEYNNWFIRLLGRFLYGK